VGRSRLAFRISRQSHRLAPSGITLVKSAVLFGCVRSVVDSHLDASDEHLHLGALINERRGFAMNGERVGGVCSPILRRKETIGARC